MDSINVVILSLRWLLVLSILLPISLHRQEVLIDTAAIEIKIEMNSPLKENYLLSIENEDSIVDCRLVTPM